jgi:arabinofuranosyltransferase
LWMFLIAGLTWVIREPYYSSLILSFAATMLTLVVFARRIAATGTTAVLGIVVLLFSQAFIDFSTSGLENALTHLLLALFAMRTWTCDGSPRQLATLGLIAAGVMTTRLDAGLLVLPALCVQAFAQRSVRALAAIAVGLLPFFAWELFSIIYYGFPFPNTAYAKLKTGIPRLELARQGWIYLQDSLVRDPLALSTIAASSAGALVTARAQTWPLVLGIAVYLGYVVAVGGDFMSGRFITPALMTAVCLFAQYPIAIVHRAWVAVLAIVLIVGSVSSPRPAMTDGGYGSGAWRRIPESGIADERRYYYPVSGLLRMNRLTPTPATDEPARARQNLAQGRRVVPRDAVGFFGVAAGARLHVVDVLGLGDPLLARLPSERPWRIGHFYRKVPEGYLETLGSETNQIRDPKLAQYYDALRLVTRGPIWTRERLHRIVSLNLGLKDDLLPAPTVSGPVQEHPPD